jgi:hypothetical protein
VSPHAFLLPIHIAAGGLAIVLGAVALLVKKGGAIHRLLLFGAMFYWLWRVRRRRPLPVLIRHDSMPLTPPAE